MNRDKEVFDFLITFINSPEPELDQEYYQILNKYEKMFGHTVPREMFPDSITKDHIKNAMKICLDSKTDSLLELLGISFSNEYIY